MKGGDGFIKRNVIEPSLLAICWSLTFSLAYSSTLKMEAERSSEMSWASMAVQGFAA
jgi:hypothetical protein